MIYDGSVDFDYAICTDEWDHICGIFDEVLRCYYDIPADKIANETGCGPGHMFAALLDRHHLMLAPPTPEAIGWWRKRQAKWAGLLPPAMRGARTRKERARG